MGDHKRRIEKLERQALAGKEKGACRFCLAGSIQSINGETVRFSCGTRANDPSPRTVLCWTGWVMKLQGRIDTLEAVINRKKPVTIREAAIAGGWHPEIQKG